MVRVTIDGLELQLPGGWDELTAEQLLYLAGIMRQPQPLTKVKTHMALRCLGARINAGHYGGRGKGKSVHTLTLPDGSAHNITLSEMVELASVFGFLFEPCDTGRGHAPAYRLKPKLTVNHYATINASDGTVLHGPDDGLFDINFEQYIYLNTYMDGMVRNNSLTGMMLAVLWHSATEFSLERMPADAKLLEQLPAATKLVMVWFVMGCMAQLAHMFPRLFGSNDGGTAHRNVLDQHLRLLNSLAGGDMTKKDAVRRGSLMDALYTMDESVRQHEEMEERMNGGKC